MATEIEEIAEFVEAIKSGNSDSFEKLYNLTIDDYSRYARIYLSTAEDVEDVMQQSYMYLYQYIGNLQESKNFKAWFSTVVRHECFKKLNTNTRADVVLDNITHADSKSGEEMAIQESFDEKSDMYADVRQAVEELTPEQKSCILLYYYENKKASDVAAELGITEAAVKSRLHKSKQILEKKLSLYRTASFTGVSLAVSYLIYRAGKETISNSKKAAIFATVTSAGAGTAATVSSIGAATVTAAAVTETAVTTGTAAATAGAVAGTSAVIKGVAIAAATLIAVGGGTATVKTFQKHNREKATTAIIETADYDGSSSEIRISDNESLTVQYDNEISKTEVTTAGVQSEESVSGETTVKQSSATDADIETATTVRTSVTASEITSAAKTSATSATRRQHTTVSTTRMSTTYRITTVASSTVNQTTKSSSGTVTTKSSASVTTAANIVATTADDSANFEVASGNIKSYSGSGTSVTIPSSINGSTITGIAAHAFEGNTKIKSVSLPSTVTKIGQYAFDGCTSLESVSLPSGLKSIGVCAFAECESLGSVTIPSGVTDIGDSAFDSCTSLTSITIPSSVTAIGDGAFESCPSSLVIKCASGSAAYDYAVDNDIKYQLI